MEKRFTQVDPETGEVFEGFVAYVAPKRVNGFRQGWFAMAQDALGLLSDFTNDPRMKVFFALLGRLDYENLITANQAEIARSLGMQRTHVNRAIKQLIEIGAIFEGPKIGNSRTYRLNPNMGWKGSAKNHVTQLDNHRKERMKKAGISEVIDGGKDTKTIDMFDP